MNKVTCLSFICAGFVSTFKASPRLVFAGRGEPSTGAPSSLSDLSDQVVFHRDFDTGGAFLWWEREGGAARLARCS